MASNNCEESQKISCCSPVPNILMGSINFKNTPILNKSTPNHETETNIALLLNPSTWECDEEMIEKTFDRNLEILLEKNLIDENNYDNIIQILDHI